MELVARTKLRRTQDQVMAGKPYSEAIHDLLRRVAARGGDHQQSPFFQTRDSSRRLFITFSADRGLCGSYNANVLRRSMKEWEKGQDSRGDKLIVVGRRVRDFFRRRGVDIYDEFTNIGEEADLGLARTLGRIASYEFTAERVDEVVLVYTEFTSIFQHTPKAVRVLPIDPQTPGQSSGKARGNGLYLYEPSPEAILDYIIPRYVDNAMFQALTESKASEHAARVMAMKNATDNAGDLIEDLTRDYNRVRQSQITREISEIAGGAEALSAARGK